MKKGDKVKIVNCLEAKTWGEEVFTIISDIWLMGGHTAVATIECEKKRYVNFDITKLMVV